MTCFPFGNLRNTRVSIDLNGHALAMKPNLKKDKLINAFYLCTLVLNVHGTLKRNRLHHDK